ncbi:MAG: hemolysin family protein [Sphingomonadales bacterium]|jgi:CBS domain containing-hemolysin-like protein
MGSQSSTYSSSSDASNDDGPSSSPSSGWFKRLTSIIFRRDKDRSLRRSLADAIVATEGEGPTSENGLTSDLGEDELMMLKNILSNGHLRVDDVMVPRADITAFDIEDDFEDLVRLLCQAEHSRLPVYRESLDDVIGMVHIKDVIKPLSRQEPTKPTVAALLRSVLYVPPSMRVMDLLAKMRAGRIHMAIVIDEFGGTDGLVTIEDLVEQFVGDIEDEHDELEQDPLRKISPEVYDADARLPIPELEQELGLDFLPDDEDDDIDTLGGLVVRLAGKVPMIGDAIEHPSGLRFEVVDGDPRRLKRLRIYIEQDRERDD